MSLKCYRGKCIIGQNDADGMMLHVAVFSMIVGFTDLV